METTDLTVVTLTRGSPQGLSMCLSHLELQTYPSAKFEVIVVALPSASGAERMLERFCTGGPIRIRCVHSPSENVAMARNLAAMQARGHWLLFLDEDLLAGSHLVESHVEAQHRYGHGGAVVGRINYHPQLEAGITPAACPLTRQAFQHGQPLSFLDWRAHNLSLPRDAVLEAGGFSEQLPFEGLEDLGLAYLLERDAGLRGHFCEHAQAFIWKPGPLGRDERRSYAEGYWLHHLLEPTHSESLYERYRPVLAMWHGPLDCALLPAGRALCPLFAFNSRAYRRLRRSVLRGAFRRGYRDARSGRDAKLPLVITEEDMP